MWPEEALSAVMLSMDGPSREVLWEVSIPRGDTGDGGL